MVKERDRSPGGGIKTCQWNKCLMCPRYMVGPAEPYLNMKAHEESCKTVFPRSEEGLL